MNFECLTQEEVKNPRQSIRFVEETARVFLDKVLQVPKAKLRDSSLIRNFRPLGMTIDETGGSEFSPYAKWRKDVLRRTKRVFGVDIETVFDEPLPKVLLFLRLKVSSQGVR